MIELFNGNKIVEHASELPDLSSANDVFIDHETTSGDPKRPATRPYSGDRICGTAFTWDDHPTSYYVPVRSNRLGEPTVDLDQYRAWMADTLSAGKRWINHNIAFDAHCSLVDDIPIECDALIDTMVGAKIIDSDRGFSGGYGQKALARDWLDEPYESEAELKAYLSEIRSKDYGDVPLDIMARYAADDSSVVRSLFNRIEERMPEECVDSWEMEQKLTPALVDVENRGLMVEPAELKKEHLTTLTEVILLEQKIEETLGFATNPRSSKQLESVICGTFGLPPLAFTKTASTDEESEYEFNASFNKDALRQYETHPDVVFDERKRAFFSLILRYREIAQYLSLFVEPYQELQAGGFLHPSYNQLVRTGRMSSRQPNAQQLSSRAKALIHPRPGYAFLRYDYSQIEFRLIVHYTRDRAAIAAYLNDPTTDFHTFVATMCGIPRKPAKNVNFCMGYGGGKAKLLKMLASNESLVADITAQLADAGLDEETKATLYRSKCVERAEGVYDKYHAEFPGIKSTTRRASQLAKNRGYVRTISGRRRHFNRSEGAHRAFNSVTQGSAADVLKDRFIATAPRYNADIRDLDIHQVALVHDELVFEAPIEVARDPAVQLLLRDRLEQQRFEFRVPLLVDFGYSELNWAEASSDEATVELPRAAATGGS